jgi:putative transposase
MDKYKNKYRIQSHRKPNWDYSSNAMYFLTIVTQNRVCNLCKIVNNEIILSDFGKIVEGEWFKSFEIRNELFLHDFVFMPNHIHAIVEIYNENRGYILAASDTTMTIETHGRVSKPIKPNEPIENEILQIIPNAPIRLPKSISTFIAGFKSAVNTGIDDYIDEHQLDVPKYNKNNHFLQSNYHDHIIRNHFEYQTISNYIINNPMNWNNDKFYIYID